ncbi:MAG: hypothetical protein U9N79_00355 [Actinomycetota bacterium]|nr:hypothetical protein [Actinomycetota bacterium]
MISTAYLRVYVTGDVSNAEPYDEASDGDRVVRSDGRFLWNESLREDAFVTDWNGVSYLCPRNTRLRMVEGVLAFSGTYPKIPLVGEKERESLKRELAGLRSTDRRSHILASPWHVPLRWFGAFSPSERDIYDRADGLGIRYRTGLGEAVDRIGWAVRVLEGAGFPPPVVDQVRDLERWLAEFPAGSMLELDYATVADHFADADLTFDESAEDVRESLEALERGDGDASRLAYGRVAGRWAGRQALTFAN